MRYCQYCEYRENEKCKINGQYAEPNHIYQDLVKTCPLENLETKSETTMKC